jgi:two-component system chemotaxis response regulator CheB
MRLHTQTITRIWKSSASRGPRTAPYTLSHALTAFWRKPASKLKTGTASAKDNVPSNNRRKRLHHRDIVTIGASAGGVEPLMKIAGSLPALDASIFIVLHTGPDGYSSLPHLLSRHSHMRVRAAEDGLLIESGTIYVAVPDHHLVLKPGHMRLIRGPLENRHRPSVDALFRSAATAYGPRVIGVVLSGYLDDGTAGLYGVKRAGGLAVVQDPKDAIVPSMPESALASVEIDHVIAVAELPSLLGMLVTQTVEMEELAMALDKEQTQETVDPKGTPSAYTCPECNGTLWEMEDDKLLRFACRVGHSLSIESMLQDQSDSAERALWAALRALEERADLARRMQMRLSDRGLDRLAERYANLAASAGDDARVLRNLMTENRPTVSRQRHDAMAEPGLAESA